MSYLTSVKTINGETSGFYQYPIKYVSTSAEATDNDTLFVVTGNNYGLITPAFYFNHQDPYNPLGLPANTIRLKFKSGVTPTYNTAYKWDSKTLVDSENNIWDIYKQSNNWDYIFGPSALGASGLPILEIVGANTTNVTSMRTCFSNTPLTSINKFDTNNVTNVGFMFDYCVDVVSGALELYRQMSTQTTPPSVHNNTFRNCGKNTQTGSAELAQIPSDWGGTGA